MSKIIVGVDQSERSNDAILLASSLAGITGAELMLVNVFDYDTAPSRAINDAFETYLRNHSQALLERLRSEFDVVAEVRSVANPSPAHGLHDLAEEEDASLIVVGSTHTGRAGRAAACSPVGDLDPLAVNLVLERRLAALPCRRQTGSGRPSSASPCQILPCIRLPPPGSVKPAGGQAKWSSS